MDSRPDLLSHQIDLTGVPLSALRGFRQPELNAAIERAIVDHVGQQVVEQDAGAVRQCAEQRYKKACQELRERLEDHA